MLASILFKLLVQHGQQYRGKTAEELYGKIPTSTLICPECQSTAITMRDAMDEQASAACLDCGAFGHLSQFQGVYLGECSVCGDPAAAYCAGCRVPVCINCIADGYPKQPMCYGCF